MESGTLTSWKIEVGKPFSAGDVLAEIQTDKASIDFVTEDDGVAAKLFVGDGDEVKVGDPVFLMVDEEDEVAAFSDFKLEESAAEAPPAAPVVEAPPVVSAPTPVAAAPVAPTPPPPPPSTPVAAPVTAVEPTPQPSSSPSTSAPKGPSVNTNSPLKGLLSKRQNAYVELFGTTMQQPM